MPRGFFGRLKTYGLAYVIIPPRLRRCYDYPESVIRTPIIHLRFIVSFSSFFRTAAVILHPAFSRCSPATSSIKQDTIRLTAARNKNGSLMTDSGLSRVSGFHVKRKGRKRIPCRAFAAVREGALPAL